MVPEPVLDKIQKLYGYDQIPLITDKLLALMDRYRSLKNTDISPFLDEQDIMLITYADSLHQQGMEPLKSMIQFCRLRLQDLIRIIHFLPFFPYSSDDGFSVIDYHQVNPFYGDWSHIRALSEDFHLCFDLVLNHVSASSTYFKGFLKDDPHYRDFFIHLDEHTDTSSVVRPRALPLLHEYQTNSGPKWCWTTFSSDQLDFNFKNPLVLLELLDILLFYVSQGARMIRLDAIAYLWKELNTSCVHLPQTHWVVQLMRDILDSLAPHVLLLSETNFPHEDNISYFGDGNNEAQIAYNFPMPPLVLHTITSGNARHLNQWAASIKPLSDRTTFLNFTASHDGIGVRPAAGILSDREFLSLIDLTLAHNGRVSYKNDENGNPIPYELNINYFDALNNPNDSHLDEESQIDRFLLSQSIALVFLGMPAIYIHSLIGSRNWNAGIDQTGQPRSINREKIDLDLLEQQLMDPGSRRAKIFSRYAHLISLRRGQKAFHPNASQQILPLGDQIFALVRTSIDRKERIVVIHNVTGHSQQINIDPDLLMFPLDDPRPAITDLIEHIQYDPDPSGTYQIILKPYQFLWLKI
ncbi:MAG: hypothetical protein JW860_02340 [Sedimentisphaerales bacterium]|nr:hypothetical protein [Sedimentisphaerales bacterium]